MHRLRYVRRRLPGGSNRSGSVGRPVADRDRDSGDVQMALRIPVFLWPAVSGFTSCCFRLFREATQLKTVGPVAYVAGIEVLHAEVQEHAVNFADGGCPTVSGVADIEQCAQRIGAVARGGARLFREATQLKTIGATVCTTWTEIRHGKAQVYPIVSAARRRVAVSIGADVVQRTRIPMAVARGGVRREDFSFSARKC